MTSTSVDQLAEALAKFPQEDIPTRKYMDDPNIKWRYSKPVYDLVNAKYLKEKTRKHAPDSLERTVETIFKTLEMEAGHKLDPKDWGSIVQDGSFRFRCNNGKWYTAEDLVQEGTYHVFLMQCPFYSSKKATFDESHHLFKSCFSEGFAWECLEAYANLPIINVHWRHWSHFTGPYKERSPTGQLLELFGSATVKVDDNLKVKEIQFYYDPTPMMMTLNGGQIETPDAPTQA